MNIYIYNTYKGIIILLLFMSSSLTLQAGSGVVTITDRSGTAQSSATSVASDNIHIEASNYVYAEYQIHEGASVPASWGGITKHEFFEDIYIYKKALSQFVRIQLTDASNNKTTKVVELVGGVVSAPVDDPILPADYVIGMGDAGLIVEADEDATVDPIGAVIAMKKAGIYHVRMHIGRLLKDKLTYNPVDEDYFKNLDLWVEQISRHGMYCHIGNKSNSKTYTVDGLEYTDPAFVEPYAVEMEAWWDAIANRYKYTSYRLAYQMFLETGKIKCLFNTEAQFPGAPANLGEHYSRMTEKIRLHDSYRNLIYSPGGLNDSERLGELGMPYADRNIGDGITTGSGAYYFSDFHRSFAGGGWHPGEGDYDVKISAAKTWVINGGCPLILSACNVKDRVEYPIADRLTEIETIFTDLEGAPHPIPITFLILTDFYSYNNGWIEEQDTRARFEAINRTASIDPNDPDGDFLSTDDEVNTYASNPNLFDTDQDNISDYAEALIPELNANDNSDGHVSSDLSMNADLDGDGISNAKEIEYASIDIANHTITQILNINDPNDAETALQGSISNVWESVLHFNLDKLKTFKPRLGGHVDDEEYDHDGDGISTLDEVNANTWPLPHRYEGDVDGDENILGRDVVDVIPYTNNTSYILGYSFDNIPVSREIANQAQQGSSNEGVLTGDLLRAQDLIYLSASSFISVDNTDFITLSTRTINFHFRAEGVNNQQVVYKEGDLSHGMSIAIADGKLISTVWKTSGTMEVESSDVVIEADKWYSMALVFDGDNKEVRTTLHSANRLLSRESIPISYSSITLNGGSTVRIGGSEDGTIVKLPDDSTPTTITNKNFEGYLDELHVFNRVLSQTAISLLNRNDLFPKKDVVLKDSDGNGIPDAKDPNFGDNNLSIGENEVLMKSSLYPNPFKDVIYFSFNKSGKYKIHILDLLGQEIYSTDIDGYESNINLDGIINEGVYLLRISKNGNSNIYKIVKE